MRQLPIWEIHRPIVDGLRQGNRLVLIAPTGSGKTTQVPQMILDAGLAEAAPARRIIVLQPRRVAARTVAARVAWERQTLLGAEVGYQIRFDDQTSLGTRICFVTEGILLRWLQDDRTLRDAGAILFDEFHERNLLSDVALALVKNLQEKHRPDLKLMVMSATLDAEPVAKYLGVNCPILRSEGESFPVEIRYLEHQDERPIADQAADAVEHIVNAGGPGDILVFMPGMGEIQSTINAIGAARLSERVACIPLHGDLNAEDQDQAFEPNARRKIVVSTNVAETSVTIDGIRHVVDGGLARVARYDPEQGINTLFLEPISRASSDQRKGRAGRTAPGICWRLWTESGQLNRPERNTPEIQRSDLAEVVLLLHSLGIRRAAEFDWLDKPDLLAVERAEKLLVILGALRTPGEADEREGSDLTEVGREMLRLPMHPRYARMLVEASRHGCVPAAALCAALASGRDLLMRVNRDDRRMSEARELFEASQESDFYTLMRAWQFARKNAFAADTCRRFGIHAQTARQIGQTYEQIVAIAERQKLIAKPETDKADAPHPNAPAQVEDPLPRCITAGFIDQLCVRRDQGTLECDLTEGRSGSLMRESVVQEAKLLVAATIRQIESRGSGVMTLLGLATATKIEWLREIFPQHVSARVEHLFDRTHKRVAAVRIARFLDLPLEYQHLRELDPAASGRCLADAFAKGWFELPLLNHEIKQFMARVNLMHRTMPGLDFLEFDAAKLGGCLAAAFSGLSLVKEAQATHLKESLQAALAPEQLGWLDEMAPAHIPWLGDKKIKLTYPEETGAVVEMFPEAQVKLLDCFQLREHPAICEGKVPVKLWLGAPDGKRLESTTDWMAFKAAQYPKLRPALQKKYPGVIWL